MNIQNLKYFMDSARLGSMTKAADLNSLSRPAISQAIQKLEQELGVDLLIHKRRSLELTQAGLKLLKKSEGLFLHIEETIAAVKDPTGTELIGQFRIGSARTLASFFLPATLARMRTEFPLIDLKVALFNSETIVEKLANRELDVGIFIGDENLHGFKQIVVGRGRFCLVKPRKMKAEIAAYAITDRRPETERLRVLYQRYFNKALPVFAEIPSWDTIWAWTSQDICGGLIPDFLLPISSKSEVSMVFEKVFPYEIKVMVAREKLSSPLVAAFIEGLKP